MRYLICCFFSLLIASHLYAQQSSLRDTSLRFNLRYTQCERKWVVLPFNNDNATYGYGFIYVDETAGFTYDLKGNFKVGPGSVYIPDTGGTKGTSIKFRIQPGHFAHLALVPPAHFAELGIKPQPGWIKYYYSYTDTVAHDYRWGWIYNDLDEPAIALTFLEQAYRIKQHAKGVEFEMAYAYNSLNRFDDAIRVLVPAIANDSTNMLFYKELGYAYQHQKQLDKAIAVYKQGLRHAPAEKSESKGELAFNMAYAYKTLGNDDEYKKWMTVSKEYTPVDSPHYKAIIGAGF